MGYMFCAENPAVRVSHFFFLHILGELVTIGETI